MESPAALGAWRRVQVKGITGSIELSACSHTKEFIADEIRRISTHYHDINKNTK